MSKDIQKHIFAQNENKWIATDQQYQQLFASSESLESVQKKLKKLKIADAVILFVPPFDRSIAP
jgi:hypothetical protein